MKEALQNLRKQPPQESKDLETIKQWLVENIRGWSIQLKGVMIKDCDIEREWGFTEEHYKSIQEYFGANNLLLECLDNSYVSRKVREEIESTLYLPFEKVENQFDKNFDLEL